jgi:hypothetical protein
VAPDWAAAAVGLAGAVLVALLAARKLAPTAAGSAPAQPGA